MDGRDFAGEIREIIETHMITGSPMGAALATVADGLEQQGAHFTALINMLGERVEELEAHVLPRPVDAAELGAG